MPDASEETTLDAISSLGSTKTKCLSEKHTKARLDDRSFRMLKRFCMNVPVIYIQTCKVKMLHNLQIYVNYNILITHAMFLGPTMYCFIANQTKISEVTTQFDSQYTFKRIVVKT